LTAISLELALDFIENSDLPRARQAICQLAESLDFRYGLAQNLYDIYAVIEKKLTAGIVGDDMPAVNDAKYLIQLLRDKWKDALAGGKTGGGQAKSSAYLGLTYGAEGLREYVEQDYSGGYKA